ncbi:MAG: AAA family ATPase [Clostridiales bacterium]
MASSNLWEGNAVRLSKIKLLNYRCFGPKEQVIMIDDLSVFIGNNSTGKTAALSGLNGIFSENSSDRILQRSDFHLPKDMTPESMEKQSMYIEAVFEFDELKTKEQGVQDSVPQFFQHLVVDEPQGVPYLRIRLEATWEKSSTIIGSIDSRISYITCPESADLQEENCITAQRRDLDRIRVIYVPAARDPSRQLKNASGTMMYQIMSSINWSETTKEGVKTKIQELNTQFEKESGVAMFGSSITTQWKKYDSDDRYSNAMLRFNSTDIETSIRKMEVVFLPTVTGKEYSIDQMGDGLRSLFYISLVDSILDVENQMKREIENDSQCASFNRKPPILTIVALEEPENHIAPHLLGKLMGNLQNISQKCNAQTIITSHSPAIVRRVEPEKLRYFRLSTDDNATQVHSITLPDKEKVKDQYKYLKEAVRAYPELYFAKLVILGEGNSEEIILPKFFEAAKINVDVSGISIVPLGGRHVNHFWRLFNDLQIPYITLLDLDRERNGGGWGRIKYVIDQLSENGVRREELLHTNNEIMTDEEFEKMSELDNSEIETMQKWLDQLEDYNVFFSAPLDIDFLMLESLGDKYKASLSDKEGPIINVENPKQQILISKIEASDLIYPEYEERTKKAIGLALKEHGGSGKTYNPEQQKLMIWYNYFFLNRGKPSTHIAALATINSEILKNSMPSVLKRLITAADKLLKGDN